MLSDMLVLSNYDLHLIAVIMAGGMGRRLWPLSTREKPKQFLKLFDNRSLLQKSYDRVAGMIPDERIMILTNEAFVDLVREQLPRIPPENLIGEPMRRDTAAAACLAALIVKKCYGNSVIITLTADHLIEPTDLFQKTILSAARITRETGALYTCGIEPTYPSIEYGHLETGEKTAVDDGIEHFNILSFKEKPEQRTARIYFDSGRYLWNSGMFIWTADAIIKECETHLPQHVELLSKALEQESAPGWQDALRRAFEQLKAISIDYAVMEKAQDVRCVAGKFTWMDVGSWSVVRDYLSKDENNNCYRGRFHSLDAAGNLVFCEDEKETVVVVGMNDVVVIRAGSKTVLAHQSRIEDIKKIVELVKLPAHRAGLLNTILIASEIFLDPDDTQYIF
jgi:mannose-1-phosphate guanylyltransferase